MILLSGEGKGAALDKFYQRARGDFPAPVPPLRWLRDDGADLSGLLVRAADDGLLEVLGPLLLGARVPMIIHRAGLAAIARPEDEAEDHDSADDGTCASESLVSSDPADDARSCRARQRGKVARGGRVARDARRSRSAITRSTRGASRAALAQCHRAVDSRRRHHRCPRDATDARWIRHGR